MSNFETVFINYDNHMFISTEQLFMYLKAKCFNDFESMQLIKNSFEPEEAKALGRLVKNFDNTVWEQKRYEAMLIANRLKYQNPFYKQKLLATNDLILVETNPRDPVWGIALHASSPDIFDETKWKGQNLLGKVLMQIRAELKSLLTS